MTKSFFKNTVREILNTKARFFSIMAIIALGVGFLAGVKSTSPSMIDMTERYYSEENLMDFRLISPVGFSSKDIEEIEKVSWVTEIMPSDFCDVVVPYNDKESVVRTMSLPEKYKGYDRVNGLTVTKGRLPKSNGEMVLDADTMQSVKIGDTIKINRKAGDHSIGDTLKNFKYKVVGRVRTPMYISFERGSTTIGDGKITGFAYIKDDCFKNEKPIELYIKTTASVKGISPYEEGYDRKIKKQTDSLEALGDRRISAFADNQQKKLNRKISKYRDNRKKAYEEIEEKQKSLEDAEKELDNAKAMYSMAGINPDSMLKAEYEKIEKGRKDLEKAKKSADRKFALAEKKLNRARKKVESLSKESWYVNTREDNPGYSSFSENADRVDNVATVFPVFFLMVAILVCVTTMTRLIDEKRTEIGTLKALGYSNGTIMFKYIFYALTSGVLGCIIGLCLGVPILPKIIYNAYKMMYHMPEINIVPATGPIIISVIVAVLCTVFVAVFTCKRALAEKSSSLMRPKAPKPGNRILLEKIKPLWKWLGFTGKVTARNLFRYKARLMMTVLGVAGCTALILAAFYLHDGIMGVVDNQFDRIYNYDATVVNKNEAGESKLKALTDFVKKDSDVEDSMLYLNKSVSASYKDNRVGSSLYMVVPQDNKKLGEMVSLHNRKSGKNYDLGDRGVIITEKLSKLLKIDMGNKITLKYGNKRKEFTVCGITEHYVYHNIYMSRALYEKSFGEDIKYNMMMLKIPNMTEDMEREIGQRYVDNKDVTVITFNTEINRNFTKTISSLDMVVWVMIICAGLLAFVVLYNLTNINIAERQREIATLKVLGFYNRETSAYIYRENVVLTILGTIAGLVLGVFLGYFIIVTVEIENVMFGRNIHFLSFIWAILLTGVFALVVNFIMYFRMKKIDMIESLKSIE